MRAVFLDLEGLDTLDLTPIKQQVTELVTYRITKPEDIVERIKGFDIVITNKVPLTKDTLLQSPTLKLICVVATGTNVVDKEAAASLSVTVCNCVAYGVDSVVQHVWSLILALHTNLVNYHNDVLLGKWQKASQFCFLDHPIVELKGKTLGIVGYGNLGKAVATVAEAFGMKVIICQRIGGALSQGRVSFDELLAQSDVISLHCPLTPETENLFTLDSFKQMKPSSFIVNAARGGIINEPDLATALKQGEIAGAATDVLTQEPPVQGNVLLNENIPNLLITPHSAWGSIDARVRIVQQTAENIEGFKTGNIQRQVL